MCGQYSAPSIFQGHSWPQFTNQPISSRASEHLSLRVQPLAAAKSCCPISGRAHSGVRTVEYCTLRESTSSFYGHICTLHYSDIGAQDVACFCIFGFTRWGFRFVLPLAYGEIMIIVNNIFTTNFLSSVVTAPLCVIFIQKRFNRSPATKI